MIDEDEDAFNPNVTVIIQKDKANDYTQQDNTSAKENEKVEDIDEVEQQEVQDLSLEVKDE